MSIETIVKAVLQLLPIFPPVPDRWSDPQIPYNAKAKLFREAEREMARIYNENVPILNEALPAAQEVAENLEVIQTAPEYARAAQSSATSADASAKAAKKSETNAANSATSANNAKTGAEAAKNAAKVSENNAKNSENAAKKAETTATTSATVAQEILNQIEDVQAGILPPATSTVAGVVKVGSGLNMNAGTLSVSFGAAAATAAQRNDSRIVNAVQKARKIIAGTGLNGGGDLSADRTLTVKYGTAAGTACQGNDARLSNARTPTAHKATHKTGGTDALTPADIGAAANTVTISAGNGLTGGGNLTANRSLAVNYATVAPLMDGSAAVGASIQVARGDHRHPSDTTKLSLAGGTMTGNLVVPAAGFWLRI